MREAGLARFRFCGRGVVRHDGLSQPVSLLLTAQSGAFLFLREIAVVDALRIGRGTYEGNNGNDCYQRQKNQCDLQTFAHEVSESSETYGMLECATGLAEGSVYEPTSGMGTVGRVESLSRRLSAASHLAACGGACCALVRPQEDRRTGFGIRTVPVTTAARGASSRERIGPRLAARPKSACANLRKAEERVRAAFRATYE